MIIDQLLEILPQVVTILVLVTAVFFTSTVAGYGPLDLSGYSRRTRDIVVQIAATFMVAVLTLPGLIVYFLIDPVRPLPKPMSMRWNRRRSCRRLRSRRSAPVVAPRCRMISSIALTAILTCARSVWLAMPCSPSTGTSAPIVGVSQGSTAVEPVIDREVEPATEPEAAVQA